MTTAHPQGTYKIPDELKRRLKPTEYATLIAAIDDIEELGLRDERLRNPFHVRELFRAIASPLQNEDDFKPQLVQTLIPLSVKEIWWSLSFRPDREMDIEAYLDDSIKKWLRADSDEECGQPLAEPVTVIEARAMRQARNKPIYQKAVLERKKAGLPRLNQARFAHLINPDWHDRTPISKFIGGFGRLGDDDIIRLAITNKRHLK